MLHLLRSGETKQHRIIELSAWAGVGMILLAYLSAAFDIVSLRHPASLGMNLVVATLVLMDVWVDQNWQPVVLNSIWALVALVALIRLLT